MVIGSSKGVFSAGELRYIDKFDAHYKVGQRFENDGMCTCGDQVVSCNFWKEVRGAGSQHKIKKIWTPLESAKILINILNPFEKYFSFVIEVGKNQAVLEKINSVHKAQLGALTHISDSSKDLRRLYELVQDPQINNKDLIVIHLVRDGRGYVYSFQKNSRKKLGLKVKGTLYLISEWVMLNVLIKVIIFKYKLKSINVSYDQFAKNSKKTIDLINRKTGTNIDADNLIVNMANKPYHLVAGNQMRFESINEIKYDEKWSNVFSLSKRIFLSVILYPFNKKWVYFD